MTHMEATVLQLRMFVHDASRMNPHLVSRLEKAAFLVLLRPIEEVREGCYRVGSEDGLRYYTIQNGHCDCSDYLRHGTGHPCKHRIALWMYMGFQEGACCSPLIDLVGGATPEHFKYSGG